MGHKSRWTSGLLLKPLKRSSTGLEHDRKTLRRSSFDNLKSHKSNISSFFIEQIFRMNWSLRDQSSSFKINKRLLFKSPPSASWLKMLKRHVAVSLERPDGCLIVSDLSTMNSLSLKRSIEMKAYLISSSKRWGPNSISKLSILEK